MATPGLKKQLAGNMVMAAYQHLHGNDLTDEAMRTDGPMHRDYMDWCEARVNEWRAYVKTLGYSWPCHCVGNVATGTQTYQEWLLERVGL